MWGREKRHKDGKGLIRHPDIASLDEEDIFGFYMFLLKSSEWALNSQKSE